MGGMPHQNRPVGRAFGVLSLGVLALAGACGQVHTPLGWDDAGTDEDARGGTGGVKGTGGGAGGVRGSGGVIVEHIGGAPGSGGKLSGTGGVVVGTGGTGAGGAPPIGSGGRNAGTGGYVGAGTGGSPGTGGVVSVGTGGRNAGTGGATGQTCGGLIGNGCSGDSICDFPAGQCGGADIQGTCVKVPSACSKIAMPVCGCEGMTYARDCERLVAKAQLDHTGSCDATGGEGSPCGGFGPGPARVCNQGLFCELPAGSCLIADLGGTCRTIPQGCTTIYNPVCGCDGKTYANDCARLAASAQLDHTGACP